MAENSSSNEPSQVTNSWVAKRDRHMQLINSSIYDKEAQVRTKAIEETRRQKALRKDQREKQKVERHLKTLGVLVDQKVAVPTMRDITIDGLRFHILNGGSKLARIRGKNIEHPDWILWRLRPPELTDAARTTPKQANIGGVTFLRSRNGNLYRSGTIRTRR